MNLPTSFLRAFGILFVAASFTGCVTRPGQFAKRAGDEIMVAGQPVHTGTRVVLWTDPGGYDAYRTEKRFAPWPKSAFAVGGAPAKPADGPASPNRYGIRFTPKESPADDATVVSANPPSAIPDPPSPLTPEDFERIRGGNWD